MAVGGAVGAGRGLGGGTLGLGVTVSFGEAVIAVTIAVGGGLVVGIAAPAGSPPQPSSVTATPVSTHNRSAHN